MLRRLLLNPFFLYIIAFIAALFVFSFGWSAVYRDLSNSLIIFLVLTFILSVLLGIVIDRMKIYSLNEIAPNSLNSFFIFIIIVGNGFEYFVHGSIPILGMIFGQENYGDFIGIPTFHVIITTFTTYYCIFLFHQFLCSKQKKVFKQFILALLPQLLSMNRGGVFFIIIALFFLVLFKINSLNRKVLVYSLFFLIIAFYLFGYLGNLRHSKNRGDKYAILVHSGATKEFYDNNIPKEFYWGYLYIASPIGNFNNLIRKYEPVNRVKNIPFFIKGCLLPDFIASRIPITFDEPPDKYFVIKDINAPTVYYYSYRYLGWYGPVVMFLWSSLLIYIYIILVKKKSEYFHSGMAILLSIVVLLIFHNFWTFSSISFQLLFPILFSNIKIKKVIFTLKKKDS